MFHRNGAFLSTLNLEGKHVRSIPNTRALNKDQYMSIDGTTKHIHQFNSHPTNSPTYSGIMRCQDKER